MGLGILIAIVGFSLHSLNEEEDDNEFMEFNLEEEEAKLAAQAKFEETQTQKIPVKEPSLIANLGKKWNIQIAEDTLGEIEVEYDITDYEAINGTTTIEFTVKPKKALDSAYRWDAVLLADTTEKIRVFDSYDKQKDESSKKEPIKEDVSKVNSKWTGEGYILKEKEKLDINKSFRVEIPNIDSFEMLLGTGSVVITAAGIAGNSLGTINQKKICRTSNNWTHMVYINTTLDMTYMNKSPNSNTWDGIGIATGTFEYAGILCYPDDNILVYYEDGIDIFGANSSDLGASFTSEYLLLNLDSLEPDPNPSCEVSVDNKVICVGLDRDGLCSNISSENWGGTEGTFGPSGADGCSVQSDSKGEFHYVTWNTASDTLTINGPEPGGVSGYNIYDGVSLITDNDIDGVAFEIIEHNGVNHFFVAVTDNSSIILLNSTENSLTKWENRTLRYRADNSSNNPSMALRHDLWVDVLAANTTIDETASASLTRWNTSNNSIEFQNTTEVLNCQFPSILYEQSTPWGRLNNTVSYICQNDTGIFYDTYEITRFQNGTPSGEAIPPSLKLGINVTSLKRDSYLNISGNATDDSSITTANITYNYTSGKVKVNFTTTGTSITTHNLTNITGEAGDVFNFSFYATDALNNVAQTDILLTVQGDDTCTCPVSGNWNILCSDNCIISTSCNMQNNNIYITGTGSFTIKAPITNYNELRIEGTSSSNICDVRCEGACFED